MENTFVIPFLIVLIKKKILLLFLVFCFDIWNPFYTIIPSDFKYFVTFKEHVLYHQEYIDYVCIRICLV